VKLALALGLFGGGRQASAGIVGHWTFEAGEESVDRTGNFPDLLLRRVPKS
jgi:hypothetical protein